MLPPHRIAPDRALKGVAFSRGNTLFCGEHTSPYFRGESTITMMTMNACTENEFTLFITFYRNMFICSFILFFF